MKKLLTDYKHGVKFLGKQAYIVSISWGDNNGYDTSPCEVKLMVKADLVDGAEFAQVTIKDFPKNWIVEDAA